MIHKERVLVALVAVIALSAVSAPAAQAEFTSANYPASATGSSTADVLDAFGSSVKCTNNSFTTGSLTGPSSTITVTPDFTGCSAFGTLPMTVDRNSCDFVFTTNGKVHVECTTAGDSITITIFASKAAHEEKKSPICIIHIPQQTELGTVTYINNANGTMTVSGTISGISATQTRNSILCPSSTSTTEAKYTIQSGGIVLTGSNGAISHD